MSNSVRVADVPMPANLTEVQKAEFLAFQQAVSALEEEWNSLGTGQNVDEKNCMSILDEIKAKHSQQAEERRQLRLEMIDKQYEKELDRIENEQTEAKKVLFERLVRGYYQAYQEVTKQLKDLMGKDFNTFIAQHPVTFPAITSDTQMKTRLQQSDDTKIRLSPAECESDLRKIQAMFQDME